MRSGGPERGHEIAGIGLAVAAAFSFGTLAIFAKLAYDEGADPLPLLALRFAITVAILAIVHAITRRSLRLPPATASKLVAIGGLGYGFESLLFFRALEYADASVVSLIFYSFPLITTVFALLTGLERFNLRVFGALVLGSTGVATIFSIGETDIRGPLFALGAAFLVAVYFLLAQVLTKGIDPSVSATWTAFGASIALGAFLPFTDWNLPSAALPAAGALAAATAFSFVMVYAAIARLGSARVAVASMMEPVSTVVLAAVFLGEDVTFRIVIGASPVVMALPALAYKGRRDDDAVIASETV